MARVTCECGHRFNISDVNPMADFDLAFFKEEGLKPKFFGIPLPCPKCSRPVDPMSAFTTPQAEAEEPSSIKTSTVAPPADFHPETPVPRSGMYRCKYCGPGGYAELGVSAGFATQAIILVARANKVVRFFRAGQSFGSCPNCSTLPNDQTHWVLEKETEYDESTGNTRSVEGILILSRLALAGAHELVQYIRREQTSAGNVIASDCQIRVFDSLGSNVDDISFVVARLRAAFEHLGPDGTQLAQENSFQASNGNSGKYFIIFGRQPAPMSKQAQEQRSDCTQAVSRVSGTVPAPPKPSPHRDYAETFKAALESSPHMAAGVAKFEEEVASDPSSAELNFWLGAAYLTAAGAMRSWGHFSESSAYLDRAIAFFEWVLKLDPKHKNSYAKLIGAYMSKGDYGRVRETARRWARVDPDFPPEARRWLKRWWQFWR